MSILLFFFAASSGYGQEGCVSNSLNIVKGRVVDTDWVAGKLIVRIDDAYHPDQVIFLITRDTKITKGVETISFADILQTDYVTVQYFNNAFAGLRAEAIEVRQ
jgi:hypothetical protein